MRVDSMKDSTPAEVDLHGLTQALKQTIVLVGQGIQNITYHRRMKILNTLLKDTSKATHTVKENEELLNTDDNTLFGRKSKTDLRKKASRSLSKDLFRNSQISSRNIPFSQTPSSTRRIEDNQLSTKRDSITSRQVVPNQVWGSTFIRKEPSLNNSENASPVKNLENKYMKNLTHVHPLVKELFIKILGDMSLPGRIRHFLPYWEILTSGKSILNVVKRLGLKFLSEPVRNRVLKGMNMLTEEKMLGEQQIQELLRKGPIIRTNHCKNEFVSNIFPSEKKDGRCQPVVNLKLLNQFVPYHYFKMEDFNQVRELL